MVMNEQRANLSRKSAENQQMSMQMSILENKTEELTRDRDNLNWTLGVLENKTEELRRDRDNLNWTLGVILDFNTFPVNEHCPDKKCQPCLKDWIQFKENCYLFHDPHANWKSWQNSRRYCQSRDADLVVIDSLQEQEFISNHTQPYSIYHGYWIGLQVTDEQKWLWVDGRSVTLQYWLMKKLNRPGRCILMIPGKNVTASWDSAPCAMENIFICETKALIKSE
ncbi:natural killer cells antigen CD94-like [Scomber japonicus]|uniref:natural killer cells antigen CD94-like n=1 Tax=Scomber japonicus TaxID=13676 RepID=UPI00230673F3|nr:natural killer cells antigen CD94-like [Scomber japonicus]